MDKLRKGFAKEDYGSSRQEKSCKQRGQTTLIERLKFRCGKIGAQTVTQVRQESTDGKKVMG